MPTKETNEEVLPQEPSPYTIPSAILIAGVLIAGAIIYSGDRPAEPRTDAGNNNDARVEAMSEVSGEDHIIGSPDAKVFIVEYSDLECPFCKQFHKTLLDTLAQYEESDVAWVYRHFPLQQLHSKAPKAAEASECAAELGGNDAFWDYITRYFEVTPSNDNIDLAQLPVIAGNIGLDIGAFTTCLDSGKYAEKVEQQYEEALAAGGTGTPFSILVTASGERVPISGAIPQTQLKSQIDRLLQEE